MEDQGFGRNERGVAIKEDSRRQSSIYAICLIKTKQIRGKKLYGSGGERYLHSSSITTILVSVAGKTCGAFVVPGEIKVRK